ncbi:D-alanyl-D-alanine carboxypeptidase family protein [Dendrosporobacter sp. 1207_IL3150]|uniref:D-alanyl-D-alanine carboxypeptidase family protein n=1 Tax=Dendrosporobacter sp. 1207_IL3150 TaxID=3084054 RepID=UPI002FD9C994
MIRKCFVFLCLSLTLMGTAVSEAGPIELTAKSAIVMDARTGKVLYAKDAEEKRYPASTTKMMTLIVALEHGNLEDLVTASSNASSTEGSSLWLSPGEQLKMLDMLYGIMLISGNDATVAVAEHISGSLDNFAKLMTQKAHAIGAKNTNFTNSSGLPDPNHITTAHDLAKIAAYGYKNPLFTEIISTEKKIIPWPGKDHDRELYNENKMLWLVEGGNGVKTGYTEAAGRCLVSGAKRNGIQLVAVVLDSDHMWEDSVALLEYGFKNIKPVTVFNKGDILKTVKVLEGKTDTIKLVTNESMVIPISIDGSDQFETVIEAPNKIEAPVKAGQKIGVVHVKYNNTEIAKVDLLAADNVEQRSFFGSVWGSVWNFFAFFIKNIS